MISINQFLNGYGRALFFALRDPFSYRMMATAVTTELVGPNTLDTAAVAVADFSDDELLSEQSTGSLPKIVYQTWKSKSLIPNNYAYWRSTFVNNNPSYKVLLWDDEDNRSLIADHYPWFLPLYNSYPREIYRVDIVRLFFLYRYGGLYADMDSECLRPLDSIKMTGDVTLGVMGLDPAFEHSMPNAIMASKAGQAFWLTAIALACERMLKWTELQAVATVPGVTPRTGPEYMTGPILIRDAYRLYQETKPGDLSIMIARFVPDVLLSKAKFGTILVLPSKSCYAVDWNNPLHRVLTKRMRRSKRVLPSRVARRLFPEASVVTYWSHSW